MVEIPIFVGLAIGLMSKGPLALVLTGFPITLWTVWNREWKNVWNSLPWIKGALLMLALSLPWYLLAERQTPGFLHYFIVGEHFQRFTVKGWQGDLYGSGHASPLGTIWLYGLTMFLPWTLLLPLLRMKKTSPLSEKLPFREKIPSCGFGRSAPCSSSLWPAISFRPMFSPASRPGAS